ncbi:MAG: RIO1 family regulatory kinase/ATPase [Candidatus Bipolaricaulota bacterium]
MRNVALFLAKDRVHGDLPQMVNARWNKEAVHVLRRDIENLVRFFGRYRLNASATDLTLDLRARYRRGARTVTWNQPQFLGDAPGPFFGAAAPVAEDSCAAGLLHTRAFHLRGRGKRVGARIPAVQGRTPIGKPAHRRERRGTLFSCCI